MKINEVTGADGKPVIFISHRISKSKTEFQQKLLDNGFRSATECGLKLTFIRIFKTKEEASDFITKNKHQYLNGYRILSKPSTPDFSDEAIAKLINKPKDN